MLFNRPQTHQALCTAGAPSAGTSTQRSTRELFSISFWELIWFLFWEPLRFFILRVALISLAAIWPGTIAHIVEDPSKTTIHQQVNWITKIILYIMLLYQQVTKIVLYISQALPRGTSFSNFPFSAIAVAVLCFPFGIIGCCMLKEKQCVKCNRSFS